MYQLPRSARSSRKTKNKIHPMIGPSSDPIPPMTTIVRRQGFWNHERPKLREGLAHLVGLIMRHVVCDARVAFRESFV